MQYRTFRRKPEKQACNCQRCGACEPKCPQNIEIIRQLEEVSDSLGADTCTKA